MASPMWNFPPSAMTVDSPPIAAGKPKQAWQDWFGQVTRLLFGLSQSGPGSERPQKELYVGRMYYDTGAGAPVWLRSTGPDVWGQMPVGTTAARLAIPIASQFVGLAYLDTDLGKPVWLLTVQIAAPPAAAVWIDATGATV